MQPEQLAPRCHLPIVFSLQVRIQQFSRLHLAKLRLVSILALLNLTCCSFEWSTIMLPSLDTQSSSPALTCCSFKVPTIILPSLDTPPSSHALACCEAPDCVLVPLDSLLHVAPDGDIAEAADRVLVPLDSLLHAAPDGDIAEAADCVLIPLESLLHVASDCDLAEAAQRVSLLPICQAAAEHFSFIRGFKPARILGLR